MQEGPIKSKAKRIRDLAAPKQSHPKYEEWVKTEGWVPIVVRDSASAYWDGFTVRDKSKAVLSGISSAARAQLIGMIQSGYFGEEVKDALLDANTWQRIYDKLIDVPNAKAIAEEGLTELRLS